MAITYTDAPRGLADTDLLPTSRTLPIARLTTADLRAALREGWRDFGEKRGDLMFVGLIYPFVGLLVAALAMERSLLPILYPAIAGVTIMGPAVASGFYEIARRREEGRDSGWNHFLDAARGPAGHDLAALTVMMLALFTGWIVAAWSIYALTMGPEVPATTARFVYELFMLPGGWSMIAFGNLAGLAFAIVTLAISTFSFPLVVDRRADWFTAVMTSIRAFRHNPVMMLGWGGIVAGLLLLGSLPFFIGLAVVLPLLGYATWHLYRRAIPQMD